MFKNNQIRRCFCHSNTYRIENTTRTLVSQRRFSDDFWTRVSLGAGCLILFLFILFPAVGHAQVMFSEVAWMGTAVGPNEEWIELYNHGSGAATLDGWTLDDGDALTITLAGTIASRSIAVLERTDDDSLPGVSAFQIYTGALANTGRTLTLKRTDGTIEDQIIGGENWSNIGGNNDTKETPQRTMTGWVTGAATGGAPNVEHGTVAEEEDDEEESTEASKSSTSGSGGGSSASRKAISLPNALPGVLGLDIIAPKIAYINQEVDFKTVAQGIGSTLIHSLSYEWNFGDTYTGTGKDMSHVFAYPGEYIVVVEATYAKHTTVARHEITILPTSFELSFTELGDVVLHNKSKYEVDIGGYTLKGKDSFTLPKFSFLKSAGTLTIPKNRMGTQAPFVTLFDTQNTQVAQLHSFVAVPHNVQSLTRYENPRPVQVVHKTVSQQETNIQANLEDNTENMAIEETPNEPQDTVIRIGENIETGTERGVVARLLKKLAGIFGW